MNIKPIVAAADGSEESLRAVEWAVAESGSGAPMLVVGSRGAGAFTALTLGSVSRYAAAHAACTVVVVRDLPPVAVVPPGR